MDNNEVLSCKADMVAEVISLAFSHAVKPGFGYVYNDYPELLKEEVNRFKKTFVYESETDCYVFDDNGFLAFIRECVDNVISFTLKELEQNGMVSMGWSEENGGEIVYTLTDDGKKRFNEDE